MSDPAKFEAEFSGGPEDGHVVQLPVYPDGDPPDTLRIGWVGGSVHIYERGEQVGARWLYRYVGLRGEES